MNVKNDLYSTDLAICWWSSANNYHLHVSEVLFDELSVQQFLRHNLGWECIRTINLHHSFISRERMRTICLVDHSGPDISWKLIEIRHRSWTPTSTQRISYSALKTVYLNTKMFISKCFISGMFHNNIHHFNQSKIKLSNDLVAFHSALRFDEWPESICQQVQDVFNQYWANVLCL